MKGRVSRGRDRNTVTLVFVVNGGTDRHCPACGRTTFHAVLGGEPARLVMCTVCDEVHDDRVVVTRVYERALAQAQALLARLGWYPFGYYADRPATRLERSEERDEDGHPAFERLVGP